MHCSCFICPHLLDHQPDGDDIEGKMDARTVPLSRTSRPVFPRALELPFATFQNRYMGGVCHVVGRGPTEYDYESLADVNGPIFFINDAVCLERLARSDTFFFAHDRHLRRWLDGSVRSTAVLPIEGDVLSGLGKRTLGHRAPVVLYHQGRKNDRELLEMERQHVARREQLLIHSGTIHSAIHFAWFCGFSDLVFIGCDGISRNHPSMRSGGVDGGYDPRLENRSLSRPADYRLIRRVQDLLVQLFGLRATYLGTPRSAPTASAQ